MCGIMTSRCAGKAVAARRRAYILPLIHWRQCEGVTHAGRRSAACMGLAVCSLFAVCLGAPTTPPPPPPPPPARARTTPGGTPVRCLGSLHRAATVQHFAQEYVLHVKRIRAFPDAPKTGLCGVFFLNLKP